MNTKDLIRLGVPLGEATRRATDFIGRFILGGGDKTRLDEEVKAIVANPGGVRGRSVARGVCQGAAPGAAAAARRAGRRSVSGAKGWSTRR